MINKLKNMMFKLKTLNFLSPTSMNEVGSINSFIKTVFLIIVTFAYIAIFTSCKSSTKETLVTDKSCNNSYTTINVSPTMNASAINTALIDAGECTKVKFAAGTYNLNSQISVGKFGTLLIGEGIDKTILDFSTNRTPGTHGISFLPQSGGGVGVFGMSIYNASVNGIRMEQVSNSIIKDVKVDTPKVTNNCTQPGDHSTGNYAIYPLQCTNCLIENTISCGSSDAGLYVGKSYNVVVRNNIARWNVAGLEIENTDGADVYGNLSENNSGGFISYDNTGNKEVGRNVFMHHNTFRNNNTLNFCNSGVVCQVIAGVGGVILAQSRVEFSNNILSGNKSIDLAILDGIVLTKFPNIGLFDAYPSGNWETKDINIHDNNFGGVNSNAELAKLYLDPNLGFSVGGFAAGNILINSDKQELGLAARAAQLATLTWSSQKFIIGSSTISGYLPETTSVSVVDGTNPVPDSKKVSVFTDGMLLATADGKQPDFKNTKFDLGKRNFHNICFKDNTNLLKMIDMNLGTTGGTQIPAFFNSSPSDINAVTAAVNALLGVIYQYVGTDLKDYACSGFSNPIKSVEVSDVVKGILNNLK